MGDTKAAEGTGREEEYVKRAGFVLMATLAVRTAKQIHKLDSRAARWIASDALRELTSEKVEKRLKA